MTVSTNIRLDVGSVRDYTDFNGFTKPSENCEFISHEVNQDKVDSVRTGISYKVKNAEVELVYQHSMDLAKIFKYPQEVLTSNLMDPLLVHVQTKFYLVAINNESSVKNITMICQSEPYGVFGWQRSDLNGQLEKLVFKYLEKYKE